MTTPRTARVVADAAEAEAAALEAVTTTRILEPASFLPSR